MRKYIIRRIIISLPMLLGISIITFTFINLAPGDPISAMIDPEEFQGLEDAQKMRESLGLDKPIPVRYVLWLKEVLQGNFGFSYMSRRPVLDIITSRMLATLELTTTGLIIATVLGTVFGVIAALRQYSAYDYTLSIASLFGISIPTFFFALIALYIFSLKLHWIPSFGMYNASEGFTILGNLHHLGHARVHTVYRLDVGEHTLRANRHAGGDERRLRHNR